MSVTVSDFRSKASEILRRAQAEDVPVSHHGKAYAVVLSNERYEALLNRERNGLELFTGLEPVALEEGELEHPRVAPRAPDL